MKRLRASLLSLVLVVTLTSLFSGQVFAATKKTAPAKKPAVTAKKPAPAKPAPVSDKATIKFTDDAGRQVEIPSKITRIVPSGQLAQIVLFSIAPDMLTGISSKWDNDSIKYVDSKYRNLPVVGQFYGASDLNLEEIAKVNPQVIIDVGEAKSTIVKDMDNISKQVGIPTIHIDAKTATMGDAYRKLGKLLGKEKEADALAKYCEDTYKNTQAIAKKVGDKKVKLIYCTGTDGLNVLAKGSYHAEVIDLLSNNAAVVKDISSKGSGNPVDMEQIMMWDPDVIIFSPGSIYSTVAQKKEWQGLTAIKTGKYCEVPSVPYNWLGTPPSINRYLGMVWMTQLLYPNEAKYNMYDETAKFYKMFYHCNLTKAQYNELTANSVMTPKK